MGPKNDEAIRRANVIFKEGVNLANRVGHFKSFCPLGIRIVKKALAIAREEAVFVFDTRESL